ncbi:MAG: AAA family ATPase [Chloroflexota bacterium]|nr:AAA family ATPase [Chloroflexota bacterium]
MYVKRVRLENYGPIPNLDIELPFAGDDPKPVVLVGENGTGKSLVLSHIVNGMIEAKHAAFPKSRETDEKKVFKLRSGQYIAVGSEHYYGRVDFEGDQFIEELWVSQRKQADAPAALSEGTVAYAAWTRMQSGSTNHFDHSFDGAMADADQSVVHEMLSDNCLLYFPADRFEEPAWLNLRHLQSKPRHTVRTRLEGETDRRVVASCLLHDIQDWLFSVAYDRAAFESKTEGVMVPLLGVEHPVHLPLWRGYEGDATSVYELVVDLVRRAVKKSPAVSRLGIGDRHRRNLSVMSADDTVVPSIFQLSSGEAALLVLFLSILRDFDFRQNRTVRFNSTKDVRGLVVIDEVDLHLHVRHQHEVLPELIKMFPRVQFVMTTHSPLLVLGLGNVLGEDGFGLYELPSGSPIDPEEFSEFGEAYKAFRETASFRGEMQRKIESAQRTVVFVDGDTDCKYLARAAQLLNHDDTLKRLEVTPGGGEGGLKNLWRVRDALSRGASSIEGVVLLHDPESTSAHQDCGRVHRRVMPRCSDHPISKGIEHLFDRKTLDKAREHKDAFIDIDGAREKKVRGEIQKVPEEWTVNPDEKTNLCNWLCENGTAEDFQHFEPIFAMLEEVLEASDTAASEGD